MVADAAPRPLRPTLAELRATAQPPEVRQRANAEHWTAGLYLRHISIYLTALLVRTRITPNGVTALMILSGWGIAAALLWPGWPGAVLAVVLANLQMLLDCCDGEVARWRRMASPGGVFYDRIGHYTTEGLVGLAIGLRAYGDLTGLRTADGWIWAACGAALAWLIVLNKAQNDLVIVARALNDLPRLPDTAAAKAIPTTSVIGKLRRVARVVPFYRLFHSVELSIVSLVATLVSLVVGRPLLGEQWAAGLLLALIVLTNIGHFVAVLASPRLRR